MTVRIENGKVLSGDDIKELAKIVDNQETETKFKNTNFTIIKGNVSISVDFSEDGDMYVR